MNNKLKFACIGLWMALCCAGTAMATNYALCVGLNTYSSSYISNNDLSGCVPDARNVYTNLTRRGEWTTSTATKFENSAGTKTAIANKIASIASTAVSGDVFVYYHSSHGYQVSGKNTGICTYNADLDDSVFAGYLAAFRSGVKVIVVLDTCHSGGMFKSITRTAKDGSTTTTEVGSFSPMAFAAAVNAAIDETRAAERAKGIKTAKLASSEIGWVTAADYDQYSWDGNSGGAFTECYIGSLGSGACDRSPYGDGDGYGTFLEMFEYAVEQDATHGEGSLGSEDYTMPQCTNTAVLASVVFGWVGNTEPVAEVPPVFTSATSASVNVRETLTHTVAANGNPTSYALQSTTASTGSYSFSPSTKILTYTPSAADIGSQTFTFTAVNAYGTASQTVTVIVNGVAPAAPTNLRASAIGTTDFTAMWNAATDADSYRLDVLTGEGNVGGEITTVLDEHFSTWTSQSSYSTAQSTVEGSGGDWTYASCIVAPSGAASGTGSQGYIQLQKAMGSLVLPPVNGPDTLTVNAKGSSSTTMTLQRKINGAWETEASWPVTSTVSTYTHTFSNGGAAVELRFVPSSDRVLYIYDVALTGGSSASFANYVSGYSNKIVTATSQSVTGLSAGTAYAFRVRAVNAYGTSANTAVATVTTVAQDSAPVWSEIPAQSANAGAECSFDVSPFVSGSPAPTVTLASSTADAETYVFEDGLLVFTPTAPGTYTFTVHAANSEGEASAVLSVAVGLDAPTASAASSVGSASFTANWSAVPGATGYILNVVEGAGSTPPPPVGEGGVVVSNDFSGATSTSSTAISDFAAVGMDGWSGSKIYPNGGMLKGGSSKDLGELFTPTVDMSGTVTVAFDAKSYNTTDGTILVVGISTDGGSTYVNSNVTLAATMESYSLTFEGGASAYVRFAGSTASKQRFYIDNVVITASGVTRAPRAEGDVVFNQNVGNVTSHNVTGLAPLTGYSYTVAAVGGGVTSAVSAAVTLTTLEGNSAPVWSEIPAQSVNVEAELSFNVLPFVSGSPAPTVTLASSTADAETYAFENGLLVFTPTASGTFTFTFQAANSEGTQEASLSVTAVGNAPVFNPLANMTTTVGTIQEFTATATGIPAPTVTLASSTAHADDYAEENGYVVFTPSATGTFDFSFSAVNAIGSTSMTVSVTVNAAPVTVPELTLSAASSAGFRADWTACDGVSTYAFQVATDDIFSAGGNGRSVTVFNNAATAPTTPPEGWTYNLGENPSGAYLKLFAGYSVVSPPFSSENLSSLVLNFKARSYGTVNNESSAVNVAVSIDGGNTWMDVETLTPAGNSLTAVSALDLSSYVGHADVRVKWMAPNATAGAGAGISTLSLTATEARTDASLQVDDVVASTGITVTGLAPSTLYYVRVKGTSEWSTVKTITTLPAGSGTQTEYEQWLEAQDLNPSDFPQEDDANGDGVSNWEQYIVDIPPGSEQELALVPHEPADPETTVIEIANASPNRYYQWVYTTNLLSAPQTNNIGWGSVGMTITNDLPAGAWFGRIRVSLTEP